VFLIQFTARPAPRRPVGCDGVIVRAIDRGCWINLPLDTALKAKVEMPGMIGGGMSPGGCADASLYQRFHALGLKEQELHCSPPLVAVRQESGAEHLQNGDVPYTNTADALCHWPETCTAIAVRSVGSRVELLAPFGVDDLISLVVQPAPAFANKMEVYRARVTRKACQRRWPKLRIHGFHD